LDTVRHTQPIGHAQHLSGTQTPYPVIIQTKKFTAFALWIDMLSGSISFDAAPYVTPILILFHKPPDMHLRSVKEESDPSRLRSLKSFLCDDCSFLC